MPVMSITSIISVRSRGRTAAERETGNRFPEDEDRVACRKRLRQCLLEEGTKKLKGKQLHPHEIVQKLMFGQRSSEMEEEIYGAQWEAIRASVKASLEKQSAEAAAGSTGSAASAATAVVRPSGGVNLGQLVPLVDVSGSMSGTPMEVAIALGILVSALTLSMIMGYSPLGKGLEGIHVILSPLNSIINFF